MNDEILSEHSNLKQLLYISRATTGSSSKKKKKIVPIDKIRIFFSSIFPRHLRHLKVRDDIWIASGIFFADKALRWKNLISFYFIRPNFREWKISHDFIRVKSMQGEDKGDCFFRIYAKYGWSNFFIVVLCVT